jgi:hypothetical protein
MATVMRSLFEPRPTGSRGLYALRVKCWPRRYATKRAWLRSLLRTKLALDYGQDCGFCGRSEAVVWHADDALYRAVIGHLGSTPCVACFDRLCREQGQKLVWRPVRDGDSLDENGGWAW